MKQGIQNKFYVLLVFLIVGMMSGCSNVNVQSDIPPVTESDYTYLVGPGDSLNIFVWRNPEVTQTVTVRPDGKISTPLVEDLMASGKTPSDIAKEIKSALTKYIKDPLVTVIVNNFKGLYDEQIRVIGEAARPQAMSYSANMSLLDVMISVGGLTDFADGNSSTITRDVNGKKVQFSVQIEDLIKDGDVSKNVPMQPGDILIIPEAWF